MGVVPFFSGLPTWYSSLGAADFEGRFPLSGTW